MLPILMASPRMAVAYPYIQRELSLAPKAYPSPASESDLDDGVVTDSFGRSDSTAINVDDGLCVVFLRIHPCIWKLRYADIVIGSKARDLEPFQPAMSISGRFCTKDI